MEQDETSEVREQMKAEQKLSQAAMLIKEAAKQFEEVGLEIDFEIKIKAAPLKFYFTERSTPITDPGQNKSEPSK